MKLGDLLLEQKYVVKIEKETFRGLSHGVVQGTFRLYKEGLVFKTNDTISDFMGNNFSKGYVIKDVEKGELFIPIKNIASAYKNSFRVVFMQHTLHIKLIDGQVLMFRMKSVQADNLASTINSLPR